MQRGERWILFHDEFKERWSYSEREGSWRYLYRRKLQPKKH